MAHQFSKLMFTNAIKKLQEKYGSRQRYEQLARWGTQTTTWVTMRSSSSGSGIRSTSHPRRERVALSATSGRSPGISEGAGWPHPGVRGFRR